MTAPRFLIDENLSPALVEPARERGFEAMHVNHLGLRTETDWDLLKVIAERDWVLMTNNAIEFRGRYRDIELHPARGTLRPTFARWYPGPPNDNTVANRQAGADLTCSSHFLRAYTSIKCMMYFLSTLGRD